MPPFGDGQQNEEQPNVRDPPQPGMRPEPDARHSPRPAVSAGTVRAMAKCHRLEVESRPSNTDKFSNGSTTAFYLFSGPESVAGLDGRLDPVVESFGLRPKPRSRAVAACHCPIPPEPNATEDIWWRGARRGNPIIHPMNKSESRSRTASLVWSNRFLH